MLDAGVPTRVYPDDRAESRRRRFAGSALRMLRRAVAAGFHDPTDLRDEPLLASIRPLPEFQLLLRDVEFPADPFRP